jgi:16S rRNA processing protein RimM
VRVLGPKGLKGGLRIELLTDWPEAVDAGAELWAEDGRASWHVAAIERGGRVPVLHLEGVTSREDAEKLAGTYLEGPPRTLDEGAWFWDNLIGLRVESPNGRVVGELVEIFRAGGNEVYRVVGPEGERLVPALKSVVQRVDLGAGLMVVADDDGEAAG